MKLSEIVPSTHFVQINLSDMIDQLGEDTVKDILSSFFVSNEQRCRKLFKNKSD